MSTVLKGPLGLLVNWLDDIRNGRSQGRPTYDAVSFPDLPQSMISIQIVLVTLLGTGMGVRVSFDC